MAVRELEVRSTKLEVMEEIRLLILQEIEHCKVAYIEADNAGYESHKKHYGNRKRKLEKALEVLR